MSFVLFAALAAGVDVRLFDAPPPPVEEREHQTDAEKFIAGLDKQTCVIMGTADWCGPCKQAKSPGGIVPWLKASKWHVEEVEDRDDLQSLRIDALPTFIVVVHGKELGRVVGLDRKELLELLKKARRK